MAKPQRLRLAVEPAANIFASPHLLQGFSSQVALAYGGRVTRSGHSDTPLGQEFVRLRATLERYLRARGAGDQAEDLIQELWFKVSSLPAGTDVTDPTSYLYRMAHNLLLDRRRTENRRSVREHHYIELGDGLSDGVDPAPMPDRALEARRLLESVDRVLGGLGERTDYIFRRHRVEGIGQREIATELGITLSAVEKHLQKAYKAIHAVSRKEAAHDPA